MRFLIILAIAIISHIVHAAEVNGIYYHAFGNPSDQAVIYLHGGPGYNSFSFEYGVADKLAQEGFYVVVLDQRGCGRSKPGNESDYTFASATQDILDVLNASHLSNPILLGHSWGGTLAIEFLKLHPGIARSAILVGGAVSWPMTLHSTLNHTIDALNAKGDFAHARQVAEKERRMFPNGLTPPFNFSFQDLDTLFTDAMVTGLYSPAQSTQEAIAIWAKLGKHPDAKLLGDGRSEPPAGFGKNEHLYEQDFEKDLITNRQRIYAIYGSEDKLFDATQLRRTESDLPAGHFVEIPGAAHNTFIDQQKSFIDAVKKLIDSQL